MNINPKLIAEIVIGISGVIGLGVLCKKTSQSKSAETTVSDNSSNDEPISFADSFVSENSAQAEADFVNAINTIRLNELFAKLAEIDYRENNAQEEMILSIIVGTYITKILVPMLLYPKLHNIAYV